MTDFTSRVHMKEKEIKEEFKKFTDAENDLPCIAYLINLWKRENPDD